MNEALTQGSAWRIPKDESGPCPANIRATLIAGIPAELPGSVHQALFRAGLIPDPFFGTNADDLGWIQHLHWILETDVEGGSIRNSSSATLVLDGVDTYATVYLSEQKIATTDNAFLKYTIPVANLSESGRNRLRLEFQPVEEFVGPSPKRYNCAFTNQYRVHVRRMQCTFGWDWVHQFVTCGLSHVPKLIDLPEIAFPGVLTTGIEAGVARVEARWDVTDVRADSTLEVEVAIYSPDGDLVVQGSAPLASGAVGFDISDPLLWYPAGYGEQPLYRAVFQIKGSEAGHAATALFGIRTVMLLDAFDQVGSEEERLTTELAEYMACPVVPGREFGFRINGTEIFALGGNWIPCDPFPGTEVEARKVRILRQFAKSGGNAVRVWGGGIYESPAFYDTCAKLGIVVLQDFMMACADYPADDASFMAKLAPEVDQAVLRLRGHSAIIHWYGDNENAMSDGEIAPGKAWFEISEKLTRPALARHDIGRSYTPSCPFYGPTSFNPLQGDSHISVFFTEDRSFLLSDMEDYKERLEKTVGRFGSEYALYGAPDEESLVRFMPEDRLGDSALWEFHTKDNPCRPPGVDITLFKGLELSAARILGEFQSHKDRLSKLAYVHYESTRLAVEAYRRKQPFCRGLLFWMLNDCWPASGWSMIDYYVRPKAAFYGFRYAARPVQCSFRLVDGKVEAWVSNKSTHPIDRTFRVFFEAWDGTRTSLGEIAQSVPAGTARRLCEVDISTVISPQGGVFVAESGESDIGWYFHGMPYRMNPPATTLSLKSHREDSGAIVCEITADTYARVVTLSGQAIADDNYFDLRAGATKTVRLELPEEQPASALSFTAWNGSPIQVWPMIE